MAWRRIPERDCPHTGMRRDEGGRSEAVACAVCGETADLRICLTCGHVGCCESHRAHDTAHYRATGHPLIRPYRCGYDWVWCYECNAFLE